MRTFSITNAGLHASCLCLGTGGAGANYSREEAFRMLDAFLDAGGNFLDTAKIYSDWIPGETSRSEKLLGAWMRARNNRARVILATKGGHPYLSSMLTPRLSPAEIVGDLNDSLQHLASDHIDLYWLHRDDVQRPVAELVETLNAQLRAGKIRAFGASNWTLARLRAAQEYAAAHGLAGFGAVQNLWNLGNLNLPAWLSADPTLVAMDAEQWAYHRDRQLAAIPYTSQANGLFQKLAAGGPQNLPPKLAQNYWNALTELRWQRLQTLRAETGLSVTQLSLAYLTSQPFPTLPVVGPQSLSQLNDCLTAADVTLTPAQVEFLTAA